MVDPAAQTAGLRASLARAAGSGFEVSGVPTVAEATGNVRSRDLSGAYVPASARQPSTVIVNNAAGAELAGVVESLSPASGRR